MTNRIFNIFLACALAGTTIYPYTAYSQEAFVLPMAINASAPFVFSADLKGIKINPSNPLQLDFIVKRGPNSTASDFKAQSALLAKYFLAILTIPQGDLWVNLSPYEKSRIAPAGLDRTFLGQDMLLQDYLLKQISSALTNPQTEAGKKFWQGVFRDSERTLGSTKVSLQSLNKIWIVPQRADIYVKDNMAFIVSSRLRVLLDTDYTAISKNKNSHTQAPSQSLETMRTLILPLIEKQVNFSPEFSQIREIYHAFILAVWLKKHLQQGAFKDLYVNKEKIGGIDVADAHMKETIYRRYLRAYKKGAYNLIQEETDPQTHTAIPRKYFSGGADFTQEGLIRSVTDLPAEEVKNLSDVRIKLDAAMASVEEGQEALLLQVKALPQNMDANSVESYFKALAALLSQEMPLAHPEIASQVNGLLKESENFAADKSYDRVARNLSRIKDLLAGQQNTDFDIEVFNLLQKVFNYVRLSLRLDRAKETLQVRQAYWQSRQEEAAVSLFPLEERLASLNSRHNQEKTILQQEIIQLETQKQTVQPSARLLTLRNALSQATPGSATAVSLSSAIKKAEELLYGSINTQLQQKKDLLQQKTVQQEQERQDLERQLHDARQQITALNHERSQDLTTLEARTVTLNTLMGQQKNAVEDLTRKIGENREIREIPAAINSFVELGQWLRQRREGFEMPQSFLVKNVGVSANTIGALERGGSFVREGTATMQREEFLRKYAAVLRINSDVFIGKIQQIINGMRQRASNELPQLESLPAGIATAQQLGLLLQERRQALLISQSVLAQEMDIAVLTLSNIETGKHFPRNRDFFKKLAILLKINPEALEDKITELAAVPAGPILEFESKAITLKDASDILSDLLEEKQNVTWEEFVSQVLARKNLSDSLKPELENRLQELGIAKNNWEMAVLFYSTLTEIDRGAVKAILLEADKKGITEAALQEYTIDSIIQLVGTQGGQLEREMAKEHLQSLGYDPETLVIDHRLLKYLPLGIRSVMRRTNVPNEQLYNQVVATIAQESKVETARIETYLQSLGIQSNADLVALKKLNNLPDKSIYEDLLAFYEKESEPEKIFNALVEKLSIETGTKAAFVESRLADLDLSSPREIGRAYGLTIISEDDLNDILISMQELDARALEGDADVLVSKAVGSIADSTGTTAEMTTRYLTAMWGNWRQKILSARKSLMDRQIVSGKLMDEDFNNTVDRLKQEGEKGLFLKTAQALAKLFRVSPETVMDELNDLGFLTDADLYAMDTSEAVNVSEPGENGKTIKNGDRYSELRKRLNEGLVQLGRGYETNAIMDDDALKAIFKSNQFDILIKRAFSAQKVSAEASSAEASVYKGSEGQHERELRERNRKITLWVYYLLLTGDQDLKKLFLSLNPSPKYAVILKTQKTNGNGTEVTISVQKREYLELIWEIFGRRELEKRHFPKQSLKIIDVYQYVNNMRANDPGLEAGQRFLRRKSSNFGKMQITAEEFNQFLKEKGVNQAMNTARANPAKYGGIDLNADWMDLQERGDAISLNIDPRILQQNTFSGFSPIIIKISPISNLASV